MYSKIKYDNIPKITLVFNSKDDYWKFQGAFQGIQSIAQSINGDTKFYLQQGVLIRTIRNYDNPSNHPEKEGQKPEEAEREVKN